MLGDLECVTLREDPLLRGAKSPCLPVSLQQEQLYGEQPQPSSRLQADVPARNRTRTTALPGCSPWCLQDESQAPAKNGFGLCFSQLDLASQFSLLLSVWSACLALGLCGWQGEQQDLTVPWIKRDL